MTTPDGDRPTRGADQPTSPPLWLSPRGGWTRRARVLILVFGAVALVALVGNVTVTVELTRAWPAVCTVDLAAAVALAAFLVANANSPTRKGPRR